MVQRNKAPLLSPLSEPALLPYNRFMLPNGIEVVYIHDPAQEVFKIDVIFEAGIYYQLPIPPPHCLYRHQYAQ